MCCACGARTTPISSQRACAWSIGKTPSFSFCQVDMYVKVTVLPGCADMSSVIACLPYFFFLFFFFITISII